jgi:hypothetical protein
MKAKLALACVVVSFVSSSAVSQRLDWVDFFHQSASHDPAIREAARQTKTERTRANDGIPMTVTFTVNQRITIG